MKKALICISIVAICFLCKITPFVIEDDIECTIYIPDSLAMRFNPLANINFLSGRSRAILVFKHEDL